MTVACSKVEGTITFAARLAAGVCAAAVLALAPPAIPQASPSRAESAITPLVRTVAPGSTATAFGVMTNSGSTQLTNCRPVADPLLTAPGVTFSYQTTNAANQLTGTTDTPVTLAAGASQNFLLRFTAPGVGTGTSSAGVQFRCAEADAPKRGGVNEFTLFWETGAPDIIPITATLSGDGVVRVPNAGGIQALPAAAVNIGAAGDIVVFPDVFLGDLGPSVVATICETNPTNGQCINPTTPASFVQVNFAAGQTRTFTAFYDQQDTIGTPFMPDVVRVGMNFLSLASPTRCLLEEDYDFLPGDRLRGLSTAAYTSPNPMQGSTLREGFYDFVFDDLASRSRALGFGLFLGASERLFAFSFGLDIGGPFLADQANLGFAFIDALRTSSPTPDVFADARLLATEAVVATQQIVERNNSVLLGANALSRHEFAGRAVGGLGASPLPESQHADFRSLFTPFDDDVISPAEFTGRYRVFEKPADPELTVTEAGGVLQLAGAFASNGASDCTFTGTMAPRSGGRQPFSVTVTVTAAGGVVCENDVLTGSYDGWGFVAPPDSGDPQCGVGPLPRTLQFILSPLRRGSRDTDLGFGIARIFERVL